MLLLKSLIEGLSAVLFHNTHIGNLEDILKTNKFELTSQLGTQSDMKSSKFYYLSCSRIKFGGYARSMNEDGLVNIVLDGKKLGYKYKGGPVDYWGVEFWGNPEIDKQGRMRNNENEERIFSDDSSIPNASKYILSIHISLGGGLEKLETGSEKWYEALFNRTDYSRLRKIKQLCDAKGILIFFYTNFTAFKTLSTKKAVDIVSRRPNSIEALLYIYNHCKTVDNIPTEFPYNKFINSLSNPEWVDNKDEAVRDVQNDIHNMRTSPDGREWISKLTRSMQKEKVRTVAEFMKKLALRLNEE